MKFLKMIAELKNLGMNSNALSKSKRLKETEQRLKKVTEKLKLRLNATEEAMREAKKISARLTELEKDRAK